ncbi:MAG: hypothetical protein K0S58_1254 [Nitrospira sp.]|nr:hypothetical protein [Nitrospira sp.]
MSEDTKDIQMAGCQVPVLGIVRCGVDGNVAEQSVATGPFPTREAAEMDALDRLSKVLGNNIDRNTSRLKNWS